MSNPRLMLLDEVSLGLAPVIIKRIYEAMESLPARGTTILVVEQDVQHVLSVADRVACFLEGRISLAGRAQRAEFRRHHGSLLRDVSA